MKLTSFMKFKNNPNQETKQKIEKEVNGALKDLTKLIIQITIIMIPIAFILNVFTNWGWVIKVFLLYILQLLATILIMNRDKELSKIKFQMVFVISSLLKDIPLIGFFLAITNVIPIFLSVIITLIYLPLFFNYGYLKQGY